ncbi:hypothetical protein K4H28_04385 [Deefgea tanakiae]|uniref:Uncharacterized protein n=1 Tax=Deefgea tanakiae TaxID=2865840 RepID=A0ABX8ZBY3_9NEIS|nr:hypothetical protein [Deefgea tanakiae]QZA78653.1 hypothetical protein K4H28_04385 [Deefgea tanakiae]
MSKLFKLKKAMSLSDTAKRLSASLNEEVTIADVLNLGLDGHLKLSVHFVNHARAHIGIKRSEFEAEIFVCPLPNARQEVLDFFKTNQVPFTVTRKWLDTQSDEIQQAIMKFQSENQILFCYRGVKKDDFFYQFDNSSIITLSDYYHLTMSGAEKLDVMHAYQKETNGPSVSLVCLEGVIVSDNNGNYYQVLEQFEGKPYDDPKSYYPAGGIPDDAVIVAQTDDIAKFELSLVDNEQAPESTKPSPKAENKQAATIAALCAAILKDTRTGTAGDLSKHDAAAIAVADELLRLGINGAYKQDRLGDMIKQGRELIQIYK